MITSLLLAAAVDAYKPAPECKTHFGTACSAAVAKWLPKMEPDSQFSGSAAQKVLEPDRLVVNGKIVSPYWGENAIGGTFFVYGNAGPPKGYAVYDASRHRALYEQGCCSWHEIVAADGAPPPPKRLTRRALLSIGTARGARLGMSLLQVQGLYGASGVTSVRGHATVSVLRRAFTRNPHDSRAYAPCSQLESLYFRAGRLVEIDLEDSC